MNNLSRAIIFMLIAGITACASSQSIMSATNDEDQDIGLGGTGLLADTGSGLGGTGIVGEITGFGSIFVNGVEIEYHEGTPFTVDGEIVKKPLLEVGDVVEVLTTDASKHTQARMINLRHEVIGRVESVNLETSSFTVQGQTVIQVLGKKTLPEKGEAVAVSGFRIDAHTIQATRVIPARANQRLVSKDTELPYHDQVERWLVQAYVQNKQVSFQLNGLSQRISVQEKAEVSGNRPAVRILQIQKSASGRLVLDKVIEPIEIPRGRQTLTPIYRPGGNMMPKPVPGSLPRSVPGSMRRNTPPGMYMG